MIIQVRGTSGSGKSTVMHEVMDKLGDWQAYYSPLFNNPYYYVLRKKPKGKTIILLGPYHIDGGGCDVMGKKSADRSAPAIYKLIEGLLEVDPSRIILCEGLILSEDVKWTSQMPDVKCLFLHTPLETCIDRIKKRRAKAGNKKPLNTDNTSKRVAVIERARKRLVDAGVFCRRASSTQATKIILDWIRNA